MNKVITYMPKAIVIVFSALLWSSASYAGDIVVIVNNWATIPSKEAVADIFLGKSQDFVPHDLPEYSPIRTEFYQKAVGRDLNQMKAVWARIVFTGKGIAPKEFPDAAAVKKAVAANPKAIGYIDKAAADASVKIAHTLN